MDQQIQIQKPLLHNILTILWWVSIWGLTELAIEYAVKHHIPSKPLMYVGLICLVSIALFFDPDFKKNL